MAMDVYARKGNNKKEELAHALHDADKKHPNAQRKIVTFTLTSFLILLIFGLSLME
jgi:hypothetical protein